MTWHDAVLRVACVGALLITSCGAPELGDCDATKLGGSIEPGMLAPHTGQQLLQQSCASGLCHSSTATGKQRAGAPADLDFNVVPPSTMPADVLTARRNYGIVTNHILPIWEEVEHGTMPPPQPAGMGPLSDSNKEILRNWLACGAPVIAAPPRAGAGADAWTEVFTALSGQCLGCHSQGSAATLGGSFVFFGAAGDACAAYKNVIGKPTSASGPCSNRQLVTANDPENSVLLLKLTGGPSLCGALMPIPTTTPYEATNAATVASLRQWIANGAPPPANCN